MQISWWTLAIQGVNFLVLVWLLQRFLYRPVQEVIEKRRQAERSAAEATARATREAEAAKAKYEAALAGIETERKAALERAQKAIDGERDKILTDARAKADEQSAKSKQQLVANKAAALDALRSEIADLGLALARSTLNDIAGSIPSEAILSRLETELQRLAPAERQRLDDEITADGASLVITTGQPLGKDDRLAWQKRLEKALDHSLHVEFEHDPELIAGAVLKLPHTAIRATWADQLALAREELLKDRHGNVS